MNCFSHKSPTALGLTINVTLIDFSAFFGSMEHMESSSSRNPLTSRNPPQVSRGRKPIKSWRYTEHSRSDGFFAASASMSSRRFIFEKVSSIPSNMRPGVRCWPMLNRRLLNSTDGIWSSNYCSGITKSLCNLSSLSSLSYYLIIYSWHPELLHWQNERRKERMNPS